ncbi:MAG: type IV toxin-antitoxin system AbiEi family antitoxin domain-containing protein [Acidimicrobiales bacterium]|jgi:very-short-patch-repair endonuclease
MDVRENRIEPGPARRDPGGKGPIARLSALAATQRGLVTRAQACGLGCSDRLLRRLCDRGAMDRTGRGVYRFTAVPISFEQEVLAACLTVRGAAACGVTAMRLYGFDPGKAVREQTPGPDVASAAKRHQRRGSAIVVHVPRRLPDTDLTTRAGILVTSPVRTLIDVAHVVPAGTLERFIGHLLATKAVVPRRLQRLAADLQDDHRIYSRRGSRALRQALARAGVDTSPDSVLEHRALCLLRLAGLPEPKPQWRVHEAGRFHAVVDFAWPECRIALEVDGFRWHSDPGSFAHDRRRSNRLQELGWLVYHTTHTELEEDAPELWRQIRAALEAVRSDEGRRSLPLRCVGRLECRHRLESLRPGSPEDPLNSSRRRSSRSIDRMSLS